jgi:hypothetical protein
MDSASWGALSSTIVGTGKAERKYRTLRFTTAVEIAHWTSIAMIDFARGFKLGFGFHGHAF